MSIVAQILEILKYILPAIVVLIASSIIIRRFLINETQKKHLALFGEQNRDILKMRMTAYERLAHYLERIHPNQLIGRFYVKSASAQDVQLAMIQSIREEFEHNISQQLYVSFEVWQSVKTAKEQEISMINQIASGLPAGASATEFIQRISAFAMDKETSIPADIALGILNKEAKQVLLSQ